MYQEEAILRAFEFEKVIAEIFKMYGFDALITNQRYYDIAASLSDNDFAIEIKITRDINAHNHIIIKAAERITEIALKENRIPVIVTANLISQKLQEKLKEFNGLIVLDI